MQHEGHAKVIQDLAVTLPWPFAVQEFHAIDESPQYLLVERSFGISSMVAIDKLEFLFLLAVEMVELIQVARY